MNRRVHIMFAGGATGGHLFPGLAVAESLKRSGGNIGITFCGTGKAFERRCIDEKGYGYCCLPSAPLSLTPRGLLRTVYRCGRGYLAAERLLKRNAPTTLVGLGGYGSLPLALAATRRAIPLVLLEQNLVPGRVNRWMSPWASAVCVSFAQTQGRLGADRRIICTGNPLRPEILQHGRSPERCRKADQTPVLLVIGGSQGAHSLNRSIIEVLPRLRSVLSQWRMVHQAGTSDRQQLRAAYDQAGLVAEVHPFIEDMARAYRQASLVVSRAGATTLAELAFAGIPALLIPYPHATNNHQLRNALVFAQAGAALVVEDRADPSATAEALARALLPLAAMADLRSHMSSSMRRLARPDAAVNVAEVILELAGANT